MLTTASLEQVESWISTGLSNEDIKDITISLSGKSENSDGYVTEVVFVKIFGKKKSNNDEETELDVIVKISKDIKMFREIEVCKREAYVYNTVFPMLRKFEINTAISEPFNSIARCYHTFSSDDKDVLILDNLRAKGYELHDRLKSMNENHIRTVLKCYARFHAISYAFKDQDRQSFDKLTANYHSMYSRLHKSNVGDVIVKGSAKTFDIIKESDPELAAKYKDFIDKGVMRILNEIVEDVPEEYVITHGDCWNNNFMFYYEDDRKELPSGVKILDWQLSSLHSPAMDLSYLLYSVIDQQQALKLDSHLKYYYDNLSNFIAELGSDAQKIFPYTKFVQHWKKYSLLGFIYICSFLDVLMCDSNKAVELETVNEKDDMVEACFAAGPDNREEINKRLMAIVGQFFNANQ